MLPKENRLGRREIEILFRRGRRVQHSLAWGRFLPAEGGAKVAFSVAGSVRGAVMRNRLKRLFREETRGLLSRLSNGWLVVVIKPEAEGSSVERVRECMALLCEKAGMMAGGQPGSVQLPFDCAQGREPVERSSSKSVKGRAEFGLERDAE